MFRKQAILIFIYALGWLAPLPAAASPDRHVVLLSRKTDVGSADSTTGKISIELREVQVEMTGPYGKPRPYRLFLIFEPQSGAFSWTISSKVPAADLSELTKWFKRDRAAFLKDNRLVTFTAYRETLEIQDFQDHASSSDEAEQKALSSASALNDPPGNMEFTQPFHKVTLNGLSLNFDCEPGNAICGPSPKVIDVQWDRSEQHWIVTLQARWTEEVTLDADYNLVSMRKIE